MAEFKLQTLNDNNKQNLKLTLSFVKTKDFDVALSISKEVRQS